MPTNPTIDRLTRLLREQNLSWLLPVLRQDFLVWNGVIDPEFFERFSQLHPASTALTPADFSPARLALIALDHPTSVKGPGSLLDTVDSQLIQMAIRSFNDQMLLQDAPQNLAAAGLFALALSDKYRVTNSWNGLLDILQDKPPSYWWSTLACLYGMIDETAGMLDALFQPGASPFRFELAVHIVLCNPIPSYGQIDLLVDLCHGPYGDLLPARERLLLVRSLSAQNPTSAQEFCKKWLEQRPGGPEISLEKPEPIGNIDRLLENLFQIEVNHIAGQDARLPDLLVNESVISQQVAATLVNHYAMQLSHYPAESSSTDELSSLRDQIIQSYRQPGINDLTISRARSALILADQGHIEEATRLLPIDQHVLPDEPYNLFAIARICALIGDHQRSYDAASRIIHLLDQKASPVSIPVLGEGLSLVSLGKLFLELHKPDDASWVFDLALQTCPNDVELLQYHAQSLRASHQDQPAAETLAVLVSLHPDDLEYRRSFAQALESTGDWEASLNERSYILKSIQASTRMADKKDIYAYALCGLNAAHPELTMAICADLLADGQEDCQALIYLGKAYLQLNETDQGLESLLHATQVSPNMPEAWLALAAAQKEIYPLKTVIETLVTASQSAPDSAQVHFSLGELYLQDSTPTLALPELRAASSLSPDDPQILFTLGRVLHLLGHADEACEVLSRAYAIEPGYPGLAQQCARVFVEMGKLEEAIAPLEELVNSKSVREPGPYLDYARCVLTLNKLGTHKIPPMKALIALNEVLQMDPEYAEAKALIAETLAANGDNEMAFQAYREALDTPLIDDKDWLERLSFGFGCVASSIGKNDVAIAALQEASQINPENSEVYRMLSDAYLAANLPDEAFRSARSVLVIDGEEPDNLSWFAAQASRLVHAEKSNPANSATTDSKSVPSEALNALAKAIQLAPTRTDLLVQLGNFQAEIGALSDAHDTFASLALMETAVICDLTSAAAYLSSAGDHTAAIDCLENAIAQDQKLTDGHDARLYSRLAGEYLKNNDHSTAINSLDKIIRLLPGDVSPVTQKIDILLGLNQSAEALGCIESTVQAVEPENSKAHLYLLASRITRARGDIAEAIEYAQKGIIALGKGLESGGASLLHAQQRALVADIYRSLIQPDQAFNIIQAGSVASMTDFTSKQDYLDFICLHTELALETGNPVRSDFQDLQLDTVDPYFPRLMAIKARLMNKAGNCKQAEQILQLALKSISNLEGPASFPAWSASYSKYLAMNSIVEAALDLGSWEQAMNGAECIIESSPSLPWSYLNLARSLILKAEFYNLCEIFEVSKHKPPADSISKQSYLQFTQCIDKLRTVLDPYKAEWVTRDYELADDQIYRWQSRAEIAFGQVEGSHSEPCEVLVNHHKPGDAAAMIVHLHQLDLDEHSSDSVTRIIKIARLYPRNPAVLLQVALAIQDENPADALKSLLTVLEQNPYSKGPTIAFCNILLAKIAVSQEESHLALQAAETALEFWPDEPAWHTLAAEICKRNSDITAAISHLSEAIKLAPKVITYHMELGKIYYENASDDAHMLRQAGKSFENALSLDGENVSTLVLLAEAQYQLNDPASAEANARKALLLAPDRADINLLLSKVAISNNDYQGAYEYANKAIQLNPRDIQAGIILARALAALGRHNEALLKLNSLLPAGSDEKFIHLERVNILRKINGPKAGVNELEALANSFPEDFNILNALARSYLEVNEPENAVNIALQALKVRTDNTSRNEQANLHLLIGQVLRRAGQLDQSIEHLNNAIQMAPDRLEPYLELGLARKERREYQQALLIFEQATSIAPEDPRAPFQAGLALKESKDYKSSETMLRRAVSLAPNDLNIRRQLAAVVALNLVHNPHTGRN